MSRRPLIAGNWKMNGLRHEAALLAEAVIDLRGVAPMQFDLLVCPPFTLIDAIGKLLAATPIELGAQDCHAKASGAFTGDVAAPMLADLGARFVILGHSERRTIHGETSAEVKAKAEAALAAGLIPIICVGETEAQRDAGQTNAVVSAQFRDSLPAGATADKLVIAYEPVWAIGTGRTPSLAEIQDVHALLRAELTKALGAGAESVRILYGGSVKPSNAQEILALPDVDGGLIGGASLKAEDFWAIALASSSSES